MNGSGGGDESQGNGNHTVRVREAETITVRIKDLLESGQAKYNVPVYGGDIISVPKAGVVYVVGSVQQPGGFTLKSDSENMSALKAIALARGFKGTAKPRKAVIIRKNPDTGEESEIAVNLKKIMARKTADVSLHANDVLFVPDSLGKRRSDGPPRRESGLQPGSSSGGGSARRIAGTGKGLRSQDG